MGARSTKSHLNFLSFCSFNTDFNDFRSQNFYKVIFSLSFHNSRPLKIAIFEKIMLLEEKCQKVLCLYCSNWPLQLCLYFFNELVLSKKAALIKC